MPHDQTCTGMPVHGKQCKAVMLKRVSTAGSGSSYTRFSKGTKLVVWRVRKHILQVKASKRQVFTAVCSKAWR